MIEKPQSLDAFAQQLKEGSNIKVFTSGIGMKPLFRPNRDYMILVPRNGAEVKRRDIVLFQYDQEPTLRLHRIVHVWGTLLLLRGDGCYGPYERATISDVIGIMTEGTILGGHHFQAHSRNWHIISKFWTLTYRYRLWFLLLIHACCKPFRHKKTNPQK